MARDDLHFRLRIPEDLKQRIESAASGNHRSMTAEIIDRLENSFQAEAQNAPFDVKQTTEMSMLTMLNFIELILDSDKTGSALKDISQNVRAQFRKDYPDHPLLSKLTDIDAMRARARGASDLSKKS